MEQSVTDLLTLFKSIVMSIRHIYSNFNIRYIIIHNNDNCKIVHFISELRLEKSKDVAK